MRLSGALTGRRQSVGNRAIADFGFVLAVFLLFSAALPRLDPVLRRGRGLPGVLSLAGYQFACEGLALVVVMVFRRETPADYGLRRANVVRSLGFAIGLACLYDLAMSWHAGTLLWLPFARQPAARISVHSGLPTAVAGVTLTLLVWGLLEGFFGVFFARKLDTIVHHSGRGWLSPGALGFAFFNGVIHLAVGQGVTGFLDSFASGYAIGVIPAVTGNAWGSVVFQTLTDAVGHL